MVEGNLLSLSYGNIVRKDIESNDGLLPESFETYQVVHPNDIVLRLTDLQNDKRSLRSAIAREKGIITSAYLCLYPEGAIPTYLAYLLRSYDSRKVFYSMGGGLRQSMNFADLKRLPIVVPPKDEQAAIVYFLDCETSKIDELVAEQERLIALLKEKRQAAISHAVTKGLNPEAPMKPSGIAWLGDVPEHWLVARSGHFLSILPGYAFSSSGFDHSGNGTRLLRGVNVGVGRLRWDELVYWEREIDDDLDEFELKVGDLVIGMDRPLIGAGMRVAKVTTEDVPCLLVQRVASLRTLPSLSTDFYLYCLSTPMFVAHFAPDTTGVSVPHISPEQVSSFVIAIPPIQEQASITEFLAKETKELDALLEQAEQAVAILLERRSALIFAAVTGQIDVRRVGNMKVDDNRHSG